MTLDEIKDILGSSRPDDWNLRLRGKPMFLRFTLGLDKPRRHGRGDWRLDIDGHNSRAAYDGADVSLGLAWGLTKRSGVRRLGPIV